MSTPSARGDDKDVIEYREHIMNTLNEQSAILGLMLSTSIPDDNAVAHLDTIALTASTALAAFEPKVPGGQAKPEVWSSWLDFSRRMNDFAKRTEQAAKVARERGKEEALSNILDALTCKSCHEVYRTEKKK
jgi:cytochrome c556